GAVAAVLPREEVEHRRPARPGQRRVGGVGGEGEVADGDLASMLGTGGGAGAVAAQVAEGVELLDEAEAEAGLGGDEVAQSQLEGAVAHRVERAEGQGGG